MRILKSLALPALALPMLLAGCSGADQADESVDKQGNPVVTENASDGVAFQYFVSQGLTPVQAAGIIGNLDQESGMDPTIAQYDGGPGRGIAQWSVGERWDTSAHDNVMWYASTSGGDGWSLQTQLDFIWYELTTIGYGFSDLKAATDVTTATTVFMDEFEICGQCDASNRVAHAQAALAAFGSSVPTPPSTPVPSFEGSQMFASATQQHYFLRGASGNLEHVWWDASTPGISNDVWGTGIAGNPVTLVSGTQQHAFARGTAGSLEHWFWEPSTNAVQHDTWAPASSIAGDPAAIVIGDFQDVWAVDGSGHLQHWYWGPSTNGVQHDTWGAGVVGRPSVLLYGQEQHAFARGTGGTLEHFWWAPGTGISHDTWAPASSIAGDPAALTVGQFQDVWAVDGSGHLQQWYWGPSSNGVQHATWGAGVVGRPSVFVYGTDQHAFARGTGGTLEHWWWTPGTGVSHDTWAQGSSIAGDPTAATIGGQFQDVWAVDGSGNAQQWYWGPSSNGVQHATWGQ